MELPGRKIALGLVVGVGLAVGTTLAADAASHAGSRPGRARHASSHTPRRDTFKAVIVQGTGAYAGDTGRAIVRLHPHGSGRSRRVEVTVRGLPCGDAPSCLDLKGRLTGRLREAQRQVADTGSHFILRATGALTKLGAVTAHGWVQGTGFIAQGYERMRVTFTGSRGTVIMRARSAVVRGFTSP